MPRTSQPSHVTLPFNLDTPEFTAAWNEYLEYRAERRLPKLTSRSIQKLWDKLSDVGPEAAIESIETTIACCWNGVFPRRSNPDQRPGQLSGGRPAASLGALQMQLKSVEAQLEDIYYPGGCAFRATPTGEKQTKAEALLTQRKALKEKINNFTL